MIKAYFFNIFNNKITRLSQNLTRLQWIFSEPPDLNRFITSLCAAVYCRWQRYLCFCDLTSKLLQNRSKQACVLVLDAALKWKFVLRYMQRCTTLLFARNKKKNFGLKEFSFFLLGTIGNCRSLKICIDKLNTLSGAEATAWYVLYRLLNILGL